MQNGDNPILFSWSSGQTRKEMSIRMTKKRHLVFSGKQTDRLIYFIYFLLFAAIFAMLLYKCPYGFGTMDETFWLTVPRRFLQGDRLLVDESHLSQFSFLTMVPEMWLYLLMMGTTEGIVLNFRYIYTVLWSAGCLFFFFRTRTINKYAAMSASLFMLPFAPYGIMAFSYNSLGVLYQLNAVIFLLCARKRQKLQFVLSGAFYAGAVLCCPYMAVVYLIYSAALGISRRRGNKPHIVWNGADAFFCWRYFTMGVCIPAVLVLVMLFSRSSLREVAEAMQFALTDPEHSNFSFLVRTREYLSFIAASNAWFYPMLGTLILMTVAGLLRRRAVWFGVVCAAAVMYLRQFMVERAHLNYLMFPLTFVGIYILAVTRRKSIRQIGILWWIPGVLYTYCLNCSSNQAFYAISMAAAVSSAASIFMMWLYCDELKEEYQRRERIPDGKSFLRSQAWKAAYLAVIITLLFQMKYEIPVRYRSVYWEEGVMTRKEPLTELEEGPEKGIICAWEFADMYHGLYPEVKGIEGKRVLYLTDEVWMSLVNENENAGYSGWLGRMMYDGEVILKRLQDYYRRNPHKVPELIFLEERYDQLLSYFDEKHYHAERTPTGSWLITPTGEAAGNGQAWP